MKQEVLKIIDSVANSLAPKFRFGSNDLDDMKQYARLFALEALNKYDSSRGSLKTFLWTHVHNQLFNLKRNNYERPDPPCKKCVFYLNHSDGCSKFDNKILCDLYEGWINRNARKKTLSGGAIESEAERPQEKELDKAILIQYKNVVETIDSQIPIPLRPLWIKLLNGINLTKSEKEKLMPTIHDILKEADIYDA